MKSKASHIQKIQASPWPYAIIGYFVVFIAGMASFIAWAVHQEMDLVRDDYYDEEIRYQQHIDKVNRTSGIEGRVSVNYDAGCTAILIHLPSAHHESTRGSVHLYRPSDAKLDREIPLNVDANGSQQVDAKQLQSGLWKVRLEWTSDGKDYFFDRPIVVLNSDR